MDYLESLNEKQLEAVSETEGFVRVIAGAGSGKTKLLVCRYAYLVKDYRPLSAGCICAGKMEGDIEAARKRERELRNRAARKESFQKRKWKRSKNKNAYLKIKDHLIVLYKLSEGSKWKYAIDSKFCDELYKSRESAIEAAFNALDKVLYPC